MSGLVEVLGLLERFFYDSLLITLANSFLLITLMLELNNCFHDDLLKMPKVQT